MKARPLIVSSFALLALTGLAAPAAAVPSRNVFPATCDGEEVTVTETGGASFWLDGQHYLLTSITVRPAAGGDPVFSKIYGQRTGLGDETIACTATVVVEGTALTADVMAVAVP
jgi:hypothetical protein